MNGYKGWNAHVYLCIEMLVYMNFCVTFSVCITIGWSSHTMVIHIQQNQDGNTITIHWKQNKILNLRKETYNRNMTSRWSIYIMVVHICQKQDGKPHNSIENRTTPSASDNTVKILSKYTVRKEQHQSTFLVQPATTIPIHEHCMDTREECRINMNRFTQNWFKNRSE